MNAWQNSLARAAFDRAWDDLDYLDQCAARAKCAMADVLNTELSKFGSQIDQDAVGHIDDLVTDAFYPLRKELEITMAENAWSQPTAYEEHGTWQL